MRIHGARHALSCVLLLAAGSAAAHAGPALPAGAQLTLTHAEAGAAQVGTYVSSEDGFSTSSYWIEGPEGLVVIDTQFLLSAASELIDWAEKATGKKIVLAIVLHPNPDKFNGVGLFRKRGIRVITSEQVLAKIPAVHEIRKKWFYDRFKPDYPESATLPESFGNATREIEAAGLKLKLHVLGKGCSDAHVVVEYGDHLFPGDLVTQGFHSWLELGYLEDWLERIHELKGLDVEYVHPGRGPSGGPGLLDQQEAYLRKVLSLTRAEHPARAPTPAQLKRLKERILAELPGLQYPRFVENGLEAAWNAQVGRRAR